MSQSVDTDGLSIQQLSEIRKQLEAEVDHLSTSATELKKVLSKFMDCAHSVKQASTKAKDSCEVLVPLTQSLYVPGKISDSTTFIVDIGTNYYVEKNTEGAIAFFDNRVSTLSKNLVDIEKLLNDKASILRKMDSVYKEKFRQELQKTDTRAKE